MHDIFIYGTLCHPPMMAAVLGHAGVLAEPARLPGYAVHRAQADFLPLLMATGDGAVQGTLVRGVSDADLTRLDWYEAGYGYARREVTVTLGKNDMQAPANVWFPPASLVEASAGPWDLADWVAQRGAVVVEAGRDAMDGFARGAQAADVFARWPQMLVRAASRLRARADAGPTTLRRTAAPGDVVQEALRVPFAEFFALEETDLHLRRFAGGLAAPVTRESFVIGDAVTVLPYDPVRDRVLLVEQFRTGPHTRGDPQPWLLETVAGRVDGFETPQDAAHREAFEEAGIVLSRLLPVAQYYPSPGAVAEYLYSYVGIADLPEMGGWLGGLAAEAEDIRAHVIGFDHLMTLIASGEVRNAPLLITAHWLSQAREGLLQAG
jgi:nudix-type nucleoside diphosphatase (YffH/AdpP family)